MAYSVTILPDGGVVTRFFGVVTDKDIDDSAQERTRPPGKIREYLYLLDDYTGAGDFQVTPEGVRSSIKYAHIVTEQHPDIPFAIVLADDLQYGMGKIWVGYAQRSRIKVQLFRDPEEAQRWLEGVLSKRQDDQG